jgi:site-specific DNA recombinase
LNHGPNSYPGEHRPIVAREVFDAAQAKLTAQAAAVGYRRSRTEALLAGKLYDHLGRPMTTSHAVKAGVRYRYYISRRTAESATESAAPILRLPAPDVEKTVIDALARGGRLEGISGIVSANGTGPNAEDFDARQVRIVQDLLERVDVSATTIAISLTESPAETSRPSTIVVPWSKPATRVQRDLIAPAQGQCEDPRAMSSDTRTRLLAAIAAARHWLDDLVTARLADIDALATREGRSARSVTMLLSLAFLAPDIVKTIVDHRMPRGIGLTQMMDLPGEWSEQRKAIGLARWSP